MNMPNTSMDQQKQDVIWEHFQEESPEVFEGSWGRQNFLVNQLQPGSRLLNIGVGTGILEEIALGRGHEVFCLDPVQASIERIRERLNLGEHAQVGYAEKMPFADDFFDAVTISEVIEHLSPETIHAALSEIRRVLKQGGRIIGTVPAREKLVNNTVVCPHCGERFHRWGHQQSFTSTSMTALMAQYFQVDQVIERAFVTWKIYNWRGRLYHGMRTILRRLGMHGANEHVLFIARKR